MNFFLIPALLSLASAAPSADPLATADPNADPHYVAHLTQALPVLATIPAPSCLTTFELLTTQTCTPRPEVVCAKTEVPTEEIEYEKLCKDVVSVLCDSPLAHAHILTKRESSPDSDPAILASLVPLPSLPLRHLVTQTVKHNCREVTKTHCVDSPRVKQVPVEVEHCHTVTKVTCIPRDNKLPKTLCEPVETTHISPVHVGYV